MADRLVTVFGGSGFIGRHLVQRLAAKGYRVRVAVRRPNEAMYLKPLGAVGQIQLMQANVRDAASVQAAVNGAEAVVNLVGILHEAGTQKFDALQDEGAGLIAEAAAAAGVRRLIHLSALGADALSPARYARSKARGEARVKAAYPAAAIFRPSVVFGPDDGFYNRFAGLAKILWVLPLIGGDTKFQPVYVGDVADAILAALENPAAAGQTYELGGPTVYTLRQVYEYVFQEIGVSRPLIPLPFFAAKILAFFLQLLPTPPLTVDQVRLLKRDNVVAGTNGLKALGITPTPAEAIAPTYLRRYRKLGQFSRPSAE
ncbi:MAG: complex I NDUFA9 subunit family protein [Sphingomonadales bacterium]|nr:complex I NDUFA9 subunit family protein [Sphingomonadales bacterium]